MNHKASELTGILSQHLKWNKARLTCFSLMVLALLACRTICLHKLAVVIASDAQQESRYKRLKRFFRHFTPDLSVVAILIFKWFIPDDRKLYITIDRTNWFLGKAKINVFMLGFAYEGIAIPLFWKLLPKAGNASAAEHIALVERFISVFGSERILGILGDREFASGELFGWCNQKAVPFYIRIKEGSQVWVKGKKLYLAEQLFKHINPKEHTVFAMDVEVFGEKVYLAGSRAESGELMIVATNQPPNNAIAIYLRRWEIENLFQSLKGRGFDFEGTHITAPERLERLMVVLAIGFCWAHKVGEWRAARKPITLNRYRDSRRPQYSYFRYGLDWLQALIFSEKKNTVDWKRCFELIDFTEKFDLRGAIL
jgi:hypothetical protein